MNQRLAHQLLFDAHVPPSALELVLHLLDDVPDAQVSIRRQNDTE